MLQRELAAHATPSFELVPFSGGASKPTQLLGVTLRLAVCLRVVPLEVIAAPVCAESHSQLAPGSEMQREQDVSFSA